MDGWPWHVAATCRCVAAQEWPAARSAAARGRPRRYSGVKAFVVRYPSASAQSIQDFYDLYDRRKIFFDTWQARAKEGDIEAVGRIQEAGGLGMFLQLDTIHKDLGKQVQFVRDIWKTRRCRRRRSGGLSTRPISG
jgi:hypothetical protein